MGLRTELVAQRRPRRGVRRAQVYAQRLGLRRQSRGPHPGATAIWPTNDDTRLAGRLARWLPCRGARVRDHVSENCSVAHRPNSHRRRVAPSVRSAAPRNAHRLARTGVRAHGERDRGACRNRPAVVEFSRRADSSKPAALQPLPLVPGHPGPTLVGHREAFSSSRTDVSPAAPAFGFDRRMLTMNVAFGHGV